MDPPSEMFLSLLLWREQLQIQTCHMRVECPRFKRGFQVLLETGWDQFELVLPLQSEQ